MIRIGPATSNDISEAIENSRTNVYCSEKLDAEMLLGHPWTIFMRGPDNSLGAILGLDIIHPGVATGWAITTENINRFPIGYTRKVQDIIKEVFVHFSIHRLQIIVKCRKDLLQWAQHLGFSIEGTMYNFGTDKSDYYIMGRLT